MQLKRLWNIFKLRLKGFRLKAEGNEIQRKHELNELKVDGQKRLFNINLQFYT